MNLRQIQRRSLLFFALLIAASGCGQPTAQVSGGVAYKGKPLTSGVVVFVEQATNKATPPVYIQPDGSYFVPLAPIGPVIVLIETPTVPDPGDLPKDSAEYKEIQHLKTTFVRLPLRFASLKEPLITTDLQPGNNTFDIELKE